MSHTYTDFLPPSHNKWWRIIGKKKRERDAVLTCCALHSELHLGCAKRRLLSGSTGLSLNTKRSAFGQLLKRNRRAATMGIFLCIIIVAVPLADTYCLEQFYLLPYGSSGKRRVLKLTGENTDEMYSLQPHPYTISENIPRYRFKGRQQHNSLGYRNGNLEFTLKKPQGQIRILAIGGSTTHSFPFVENPD